MMTPAWDDLNDFLSSDDFAAIVTVELANGTTRTFKGIFDDPYFNAQLGEYEADTSRPRITCKMADVAGVKRGDTVTFNGQAYNVLTSPHGDGTGMAVLEIAIEDGLL